MAASAALKLQQCSCSQFEKRDAAAEPPSTREEFQHFIRHRPIQPPQSQVRKTADSTGRTFQASWYSRFPWLEYSVENRTANCFFCRHFSAGCTYAGVSSGGGHAAPDQAFTGEKGFSNWKAALEKGKGFDRHQNSSAHKHAVEAYKSFMAEKPVDAQLDSAHARNLAQRTKTILQNRLTMARLFLIVMLLARLGLPFRGHDESEHSQNKGVFLEFVHFLAEHGDEVLSSHLKTAAKNATYLSHMTQNDMIGIVGQAIKDEVIRRAKDALFFVLIMDETRDISHTDQLVIMIRYVLRDSPGIIEERVLGIVNPTDKTGEALEKLVLDELEKSDLDLSNVVGQCYDGGANFAGAFKGVQARIRERNPRAFFVHCFAHSLNRAVVNSMNHPSIPEARTFFSILELLVTSINSSASRYAYFMKLQGQYRKELGTGGRSVVPGKGISDTRWYSRASTLQRFCEPAVFRAAVETMKHAAVNASEAAARATALGLVKNITAPRFIVMVAAFQPVLSAVHIVSQYLQTVNIDIGAAIGKVQTLQAEIQSLRTDGSWSRIMRTASGIADSIGEAFHATTATCVGDHLRSE